MNTIQNKFDSVTVIENIPYINSVSVVNIYKRLSGKSGTTQKKLVNELKLTNCLIVLNRSKDPTKVGTVISKLIANFKSQIHHIYISVDELLQPKEGPNKQNHIRLLQLIADMPDHINESESDNRPDDQVDATNVLPIVVASAAPETNYTRTLMPIIRLEEHEMFRDANDQVFPIEVRGERNKDKILFKAKDIAGYFEIDNFIKNMVAAHTGFKYNIDYIVLESNDNGLCMIQNLQEDPMDTMYPSNSSENLQEDSMGTLYPLHSSINGRRINHDCVYLTLSGLIRTATISRSGNANMIKVFDWLTKLFYIHQFGSYEERNELAQSLFKQVLNDKLAGLYCIDLGTFNDLYNSMNISRVTYPPEIYGNYRVCKFGLSENISTRLTQHKNKKTGYGQWSSDVQFKWLILLSPSQLPKAEKILSNLLKADGYTFDHSDTSKNHTELIMFDPLKEHKIKQIYRQVLDLYPSKENELSKALEDAQASFETKINLIQATADNAIMKARHETQLIQSEAKLTIQSISHKNEMLQMQLKLAQMGIN